MSEMHSHQAVGTAVQIFTSLFATLHMAWSLHFLECYYYYKEASLTKETQHWGFFKVLTIWKLTMKFF